MASNLKSGSSVPSLPYIRGTAQVGRFGEKAREARLRWYGHVYRPTEER